MHIETDIQNDLDINVNVEKYGKKLIKSGAEMLEDDVINVDHTLLSQKNLFKPNDLYYLIK